MIETIAPSRPLTTLGSPAHPLRRLFRTAIGATVSDRLLWPLWALLNAALLILVLNARTVLPARFFYDSGHIQAIAQKGLEEGKGDQSFIAVGELYNILGLADSLVLTNVVSWAVLAVIHLLAPRRPRGAAGTPVWAPPMFVVSFALGCVFLSSYSKDAVVLAIAAVAVFAVPGLLGEIAMFGSLALYAALFRNYWVLVVALLAALRIADRFVPRRWMLLVIPPLCLAAAAVAHQVLTGTPIDNARTLANAGRMGSADAASMIPTYIDLPDPLGTALNAPVTWLSLLVPVPLLTRGSLYYGSVAVLMAVIWVAVLIAVLRRTHRRPLDRVGMRCLLLSLAFVTVQAVFEPDYGSALRHLSPLLVLIAFGIGQALRSSEQLARRSGRHRAALSTRTASTRARSAAALR